MGESGTGSKRNLFFTTNSTSVCIFTMSKKLNKHIFLMLKKKKKKTVSVQNNFGTLRVGKSEVSSKLKDSITIV